MAPGGAGTNDGCRLGVVSELGRRIDAQTICSAHALLAVWLRKPKTVLASSSAAEAKPIKFVETIQRRRHPEYE